MPSLRHKCVVFPAPALPAGYELPLPVPLEARAAVPAAPPRPLPQTFHSKRPCRMFPAVSPEYLAAMNARLGS